jgi:hypothetical protein
VEKMLSTLYVNSYFIFLCHSVGRSTIGKNFLKACFFFFVYLMRPHIKVKRHLLLEFLYHMCGPK